MRLSLASVILAATLTTARAASAFCGFYVSGADSKMFNNATMVVLMRDGTRTVLSMQNNYQGPPDRFAMVVPVPIVLQKENVKTLPREVFDRVDQLAAPRLVEYWEQDPCGGLGLGSIGTLGRGMGQGFGSGSGRLGGAHQVKIEAEFTVGEYEVVILSAKESTGLDAWLRAEGYQIPEGAEPVLRPYVQSGMHFFVARVDPKKVTFENGMATLSPLRFHYDSPTFTLPVRLGLLNSAGTQDLIVHTLAIGQRYEVANYPRAFIPTNLDVNDKVRGAFGAFYAALFDRTVQSGGGAVVTEYAWDAGSCDPCPVPGLRRQDLLTLGGDLLPDSRLVGRPRGARFVLTRLHVRYGKDNLGEDLVFREAPPITGGRERMKDGKLERGAVPGEVNNFQARYAIRHPWEGPITCADPQRGIWGARPNDGAEAKPTKPTTARDVAFAPRGGVVLADFVSEPQMGSLPAPAPNGGSVNRDAARAPAAKGCNAGSVEPQGGAWIGLALALGMFRSCRRGPRVDRR